MTEKRLLLLKIRATLIFFITALVLSGVTAFPLRQEMNLLNDFFGAGSCIGEKAPAFAAWLAYVRDGVEFNAEKYPFMAYGTDWLAFAHLMIAVAFFGPLRDPVKNIWVLHFGLIACVMIFPLAFLCGTLRGIPLGWKLIDCSFGFFGAIPLLLVLHWTRKLMRIP